MIKFYWIDISFKKLHWFIYTHICQIRQRRLLSRHVAELFREMHLSVTARVGWL